MQMQINTAAQSKRRVISEEGIAKTFQDTIGITKNKPKLLDRVSIYMRVKHYSRKTEESGLVYRYYVHESTIQKAIRQAVQKAKILICDSFT